MKFSLRWLLIVVAVAAAFVAVLYAWRRDRLEMTQQVEQQYEYTRAQAAVAEQNRRAMMDEHRARMDLLDRIQDKSSLPFLRDMAKAMKEAERLKGELDVAEEKIGQLQAELKSVVAASED